MRAPPTPPTGSPAGPAGAAADLTQRSHAILRSCPVISRARCLLESIRPELQQYVVERNWDGRPFDRDTRSIICERAKGTLQERAFGTERDVHEVGCEWLVHSAAPVPEPTEPPRAKPAQGWGFAIAKSTEFLESGRSPDDVPPLRPHHRDAPGHRGVLAARRAGQPLPAVRAQPRRHGARHIRRLRPSGRRPAGSARRCGSGLRGYRAPPAET